MPCGITGDYFDQMLKSTEKGSEDGLNPAHGLLKYTDNLEEAEAVGGQEEVKGGTDGRF